MSRLVASSLCSLLAAAALAPLAACDGDGGGGASAQPIRFANLTAPQREAALRGAMGMSAAQGFLALFMADLDASDPNAPCPTRTIADKTVTYAASGCTGKAFGATYSGKAIAENSPVLDGLFADPEQSKTDPTRPMKLTFENFHADRAPAHLILDGWFEQSSPVPQGAYSARMSLTIDDGVPVHIDTHFTCAGDGGFCNSGAGDFGEIVGLGRFDIDTQVRLSDTPSGTVTLHGADTLRLDFADKKDDCVPYTIDGVKAGEICQEPEPDPTPDPTPEPGDPTAATGFGRGCDDTTVDFTAWTRGLATSVKIVAKKGNQIHEYPLAHASHDDAFNEEVYQATFDLASTPFSCADLDAAGIRVVALFTDGPECYDGGAESELTGLPCQ